MTRSRLRFCNVFHCFAILLAFGSVLSAATINVPADVLTIQGAIADAGTVNGDEVVVAAGTYVENINFLGKAITLRSASGDPSDTIIDGNGNFHVVTCESGEALDTILEGFTISGGNANGGSFPNNVGGGMYIDGSSSSPTITNCIFWGDAPDEIFNQSGGTPTVSSSDLQGGLPAGTVDGGGNIDATPFFADANGPDNLFGTADDNLRLQSASPCIDAGDNTAVPAGVTTDLDGAGRFIDLPQSLDTGIGTPPPVDMGAYENAPNTDADGDGVPDGSDRCPGFDDQGLDEDNDGTPDACDDCSLIGDINCDGIVNEVDFALIAQNWLETL